MTDLQFGFLEKQNLNGPPGLDGMLYKEAFISKEHVAIGFFNL